MAGEPRLLRRPLLVIGQRLVIGFNRAAFDEVR
jgi:arsenate reductase-like glutaredoxin family protein